MSAAKQSNPSSKEQGYLKSNLALMVGTDGGVPAVGFDVVIVCTSSENQARYWQSRLHSTRGKLLLSSCTVFVVYEDWEGGAGNALGSLYAFEKADALSRCMRCFSEGLLTELVRGEISCAMYHTAGKGTRLAPLPASENNNKPGVKLPVLTTYDEDCPLSILEAVIKQTSVYSVSQKSRLSVFWGDQVFIPSAETGGAISHHIQILCKLGPMMNEEEWKERRMEKYGLIAVGASDEAVQVEKVNYSTAQSILRELGTIKCIGVSLGSFSISSRLLVLLLCTFKPELQTKKGKLDTDPHLWMPLTLSEEVYISAMARRNIPEEWSSSHYRRMSTLKERLLQEKNNIGPRLGLCGAVNIGNASYWWDYGQLELYYQNAALLTEKGDRSKALSSFFGINETSRIGICDDIDIDEESVVSGSLVTGSGNIKKSVLCQVRAQTVEASGAVLMNVVAQRIVAPMRNIIYNVVDTSEEGLVLKPGDILVGVHDETGYQRLVYSNLDVDGGTAWNEILRDGQPSFAQLYKSNSVIDIEKVNEEGSKAAISAWCTLCPNHDHDVSSKQ